MENSRRVRVRRALCRAVVVMAAGVAVAGSGAATAKPAAPSVLKAPYAGTVDWSSCDDGAGTSICSASSTASTAGDGSAVARLDAKAPRARGRALAIGGPRSGYRLTSPVAGVRYRFVFDNVDAVTTAAAALVPDLTARAFVGGRITHSKCDACNTTVYHDVANSYPLTGKPASVQDQTYSFDVEVRNPGGRVPAGTLAVTGLFVADVGPFAERPEFATSATANVTGRLAQIDVALLPA